MTPPWKVTQLLTRERVVLVDAKTEAEARARAKAGYGEQVSPPLRLVFDDAEKVARP